MNWRTIPHACKHWPIITGMPRQLAQSKLNTEQGIIQIFLFGSQRQQTGERDKNKAAGKRGKMKPVL